MGRFSPSRSNRQGRQQQSGSSHITGSVFSSGSMRGHEIHFVHGAADLGQATLKWLPMGYGVAEGSSASYPVRFVCPASGSWKRTLIRSAGAAGSSTLRLYRSQDGTANPSTFREHVTVNIAATNKTYAFDPSGSLHFHEGDVIAFSFDPASNPGHTNYTHILELYTRKDIPS